MTSATTTSVSLDVRDVHLAFGPNRVLRGVDLSVPRGATACVIGPSGSGKSTLLRTINRLIEPDRGDVLLDGRSVLGDDPDALRQRVGMVFQQFNLFPHMSVLRNVTLALRRLSKLAADEAVELSPAPSWSWWGWPARPTPGRRSSPAVSSSGWRSPARWRCSPR